MDRVDDLDVLWVGRYRQAARLCGIVVAVLGLSVLLGWYLDEPLLTQVLPGLASMKPNTAVGFLFSGTSLAVSSMQRPPHGARIASIVLAAFVAFMGLLTLTEYLLALDLGIDQILIHIEPDPAGQAHPGRMAQATAAALLCLGLALALQGAGRQHRVSQVAAAAGGLIGFLAVLGYSYGVDALYGVGAYSSVALHTAAGLVVLCFGTLLARPSQGLMRLLADTTAGGVTARRLLPFVLGAPFILGLLHVQAERGTYVKGAFGIALITVAYVLLFAAMVWRTANALRLSDLQRRAVQRDLHKRDLQLDDIIRSVMDGVVVMDGQHRIVLFNPAAEEMFGRRSEDMVGQTLETLLPRSAWARHDDLVQAFGAGSNDGRRMGARLVSAVRADGRHFFAEVSISKLDAEGNRYYTAVLRDVTELREKTEQARLAAETANRMKSAFLANMSHEIRTPLNAILGLSGLLQYSGLTSEQAERLNKIDIAARHLLSIVNDILDLSKIETGRLHLEQRDFHLSALVDNVLSIISEQARSKGIVVRVDLDAVTPWLHGDVTRLGQALLNYAGNAVKFTKHGEITLRARVVDQNEADLLVRFEVQDTGVGIAADRLPRLFNVFEQADTSTTRTHGGSGLGLAITKHLAQLMGGDVGVSSVPGEGSTFWFTARLSLGQGPQPAPSVGMRSGPENELRHFHRGARVLLVEDNPVNREVAQALLERAGLNVDSAEDGQQAVDKVKAHTYDVILMDVQMPVLDGLAATRTIRALPKWATRPIIGLSANAFNEDRTLCLQAGMNDFVAKPVEPSALFGALLHWLPKRATAVE